MLLLFVVIIFFAFVPSQFLEITRILSYSCTWWVLFLPLNFWTVIFHKHITCFWRKFHPDGVLYFFLFWTVLIFFVTKRNLTIYLFICNQNEFSLKDENARRFFFKFGYKMRLIFCLKLFRFFYILSLTRHWSGGVQNTQTKI